MSHFDNQANNWDTPEKVSFFEKLSSNIMTELSISDSSRILDFGCGTGLFGLNFLTCKNELVGIDTSAGMLEVMNKKVDSTYKLKTYLLNLEEQNLPMDIGKFDLIVSAMAFHHINQPEHIIQKLRSLLNKNGTLVIMDLDKEDGSFHPDNETMGVKHFGFSKEVLESWANKNKFNFTHTIYSYIEKNDCKYGQFLAYYKFK